MENKPGRAPQTQHRVGGAECAGLRPESGGRRGGEACSRGRFWKVLW